MLALDGELRVPGDFPAAPEREGFFEVGYGEGDDGDAGVHGD